MFLVQWHISAQLQRHGGNKRSSSRLGPVPYFTKPISTTRTAVSEEDTQCNMRTSLPFVPQSAEPCGYSYFKIIKALYTDPKVELHWANPEKNNNFRIQSREEGVVQSCWLMVLGKRWRRGIYTKQKRWLLSQMELVKCKHNSKIIKS